MKSNYIGIIIITLFLAFPDVSVAQDLLPRRSSEAVVLEGAKVPKLLGKGINKIVAYRFNDEQGWRAIPFQVDEKDSVTAKDIYGNINPGACINDVWCSGLETLRLLTYVDKNTFTGPDKDISFDSNDEIVFMIKDAGVLSSESDFPTGVDAKSGVKVTVTDPLDGSEGIVYLFEKDPNNKGSAESATESYVNYKFNLVSGAYKNDYIKERGPNPEKSSVSTAYYDIGFSERWIKDELRIKAGSASGVDILDRHKMLFAPDVCERHEETFSYGEGAFIINKSGPVRAIRSYMGANSGPLTQREHIFYEEKEVLTTWLRVHPIQGIMDFYDYSPAAEGMLYSNNNNLEGQVINGVQDKVAAGKLEWELLTGDQGTLFLHHQLETGFKSLDETSYYIDDKNPTSPQCTGDEFAIGSSGWWIKSPIPNTDVRVGDNPQEFKLTRTSYFSSPDPGKKVPELYSQNLNNPIKVDIRSVSGEDEVFKVYPNSFDDQLFVEMESKSTLNSIKMWNMVGKLVFERSFLNLQIIELNTVNLPGGVYILRVEASSGKTKNIKLIKN